MTLETTNFESQRAQVVHEDLGGNSALFDLLLSSSHGVLTQFGVTDSIDPENPTEAANSRIQQVIAPLATHQGVMLTSDSLRRVASAILHHCEEGVRV